MGKFIDLTGKTFENLKVLKRAESKILTDWANTFNIKPNVVRNRIKLGWNEIDALKTPVRRR